MSEVVSVIDSSSLIAIKSAIPVAKRAALYQALSGMVLEGRLVVPSQVVSEVKRGANPKFKDEALEWLLTVEQGIVCSVDLNTMKVVMERVGDVVDHAEDAGDDDADPYVIALALSLRNQGRKVRIITEDRRDRLKLSLTTAASVFDVTATPLVGFIRAERIL
jgi:rRNA maturation endonuclease Nob1